MKIEKIAGVCCGQDGAIFGDLFFRLDVSGKVSIYDANSFEFISDFHLDKSEYWLPHSNCCFFGNQYVSEKDELPVFYTNVYNNYGDQADRREGVLLAYRITKKDGSLSSELIQIIKIGFVEDLSLWKSLPENKDTRSYGNFLQDNDTDKLWAFTMRDKEKTTRFISFNMPKIKEGIVEPLSGVKTVTLTENDILSQFDIDYQYFIQGACMKNGIIYSLEGYGVGSDYKGRIKLIDAESKKQMQEVNLSEFGCIHEPECIDFYGERCIYGDSTGDIFEISF